jgi:hypothetical protein
VHRYLRSSAANTDQGKGDESNLHLAHGANLPPVCSRSRADSGFRGWPRCWLGRDLARWPGDWLGRADQVPGDRDHPAQRGRHLHNGRPQRRGFAFGGFTYRRALRGRLSPYLCGLAFRDRPGPDEPGPAVTKSNRSVRLGRRACGSARRVGNLVSHDELPAAL